MSGSLSFHFLPDFAALRQAAPQLAGAAVGEPFYDIEWFENLAARGFDPSAPLLLARAGNLVLALADGEQLVSFSNYYSALYGPLGGAMPDEAECAALAAGLHADSRRWPVIQLQPLASANLFYSRLAAALSAAGYRVDRFFCFGNWWLSVAGRDYAAYSATLPARLQNTLRRAGKKLERAGKAEFVIQRGVDDQLEAAIADFVAIYAASWKQPEPFPEFIPGLCRLAARRGWLRLGLLRLDGHAIAAQIWLVCAGKASIFKLAYRSGYEQLSPGSLLTAELMRHAIDIDGVGEIDYLSGDDAYKRDWMSERRERIGLVAFRTDTPAGLAAAARHYLGKLLRRRKSP